MLAATGNDIILSSGSANVTSASYALYSATFTVPANETKYVGFQLFAAGAGGCSARFLAIVFLAMLMPHSKKLPHTLFLVKLAQLVAPL